MSHEEFEELAPLYALGALDGDDLVRFAKHLSECGACERMVREYGEAATGLAYSLPAESPPVAVRERILERVREVPRVAVPFRRQLNWAAAAAILVVAGLSVLLLRSDVRYQELEKEMAGLREKIEERDREIARFRGEVWKYQGELAKRREIGALLGDPAASIAAMKGTPDAKEASGRVVWKGKQAAMVAANLPALEQKKAYVLWILVKDKAPLAVAEYGAVARGQVAGTADLPEDFKDVAGFAVSLEDAGQAHPAPTKIYMLPAQ